MRRRLTIAIATGALLAASAAQASNAGFYVSGMGGVTFLPNLHYRAINAGIQEPGFSNENFDTGYAYGGAVGYDTGNGWRVEVQSLYQHSQLSHLGGVPQNGHLTTTGLMLNGTYDLAPLSCGCVTPFIGAGIGMANVGGEVNGLRGHQWKPAYQLEAGLRTEIAPNTSLFGEYRFSQSESAKLEDPTDPTNAAHQHFADHAILAGITYHFSGL